MAGFLHPILLKHKVFISIETRRLIDAAFNGLVNRKREPIRQMTELISKKGAFSEATERYVLKLRQELALEC